LTKDILDEQDGKPATLERTEAAALVGPAPAPAAAVQTSEHLGQRAAQIVRALAQAAPYLGMAVVAVAAAPLVVVGGAIAGLATLDPIIFGAVPAVAAKPGEPAAWYVVARWDW
jgi:hypothetical protein